MKKTVAICYLTLSVFFLACSNENTNSEGSGEADVNASEESTDDKIEASYSTSEVEQQVLFIREKHDIITSKMVSGAYTSLELEEEFGGGFSTYKRSMDGEQIRFASVQTCHDHGCDETSYYFWDDKLIFKFEEGSFWVGNADEVSEKRTYYLNENEIRCLTRSIKGPEGYEATKKSLAKKIQDTLQCNAQFDRATIKKALEFTNDEIKEIGTLIKVEDGAYPQFTLTMNFPGQNEESYFSLNAEAVRFDHSSLYTMIGKTVEVSFINKNENFIHDILYNNKSVFRENTGEKKSNWKSITGTLQGAESDTRSDLPGEFAIIPEDGSQFIFEAFIDSKIVEVNEQTVTAYYTERENKTITNVKLADNQTSVEPSADHYICYTDDKNPERIIWVSFAVGDKAIQVKYKGASSAIDLVFDKVEFVEGSANSTSLYNEMYEGKLNGVYKLTHAGIWDYVEYVRGKDGEVFKFTIDHDANPYGKSPCF